MAGKVLVLLLAAIFFIGIFWFTARQSPPRVETLELPKVTIVPVHRSGDRTIETGDDLEVKVTLWAEPVVRDNMLRIEMFFRVEELQGGMSAYESTQFTELIYAAEAPWAITKWQPGERDEHQATFTGHGPYTLEGPGERLIKNIKVTLPRAGKDKFLARAELEFRPITINMEQ